MTTVFSEGVHEVLGAHSLVSESRREREVYAEAEPEALPRVARDLAELPGSRLLNVVGLDERPLQRGFRVLFTFALPEQQFVTLAAHLAGRDPRYPAVSIDVHAADWYERENFDLLGIVPEGHPLPGNLVLHYDWPEGIYPLRKDIPQDMPWPERLRPIEPPPRATGPGVFQYTLGPVRSGIMESGRFIISSLGEEIADVATRLFFKHRGIEKQCEDLPLEFVMLYAERVAANSAIAHSLAFAQAVETATGADVPRRAQLTRVVLAEMERLYNHCNSLANQAEATGLSVGHAQGAILTEQLRCLNATVTGHRYLFGSITPGGVKIDLTPHLVGEIRRTLARWKPEFRRYTDALMTSHSHLDRLEETGIITTQVAHDHGLVGPLARASGLDSDMRRDHPYAGYGELSFAVPTYQRGDALARNRVWIDEAFQSITLIIQALDALPVGPLRVPVPPLPPFVEAQGYAEGPRGSVVHWLMANELGTLYRYKIRPASFVNWHVFHLAAAGSNILTDFPIIDRSFALVLASNDR